MGKLLGTMAMLSLLSGCATGWPWAHGPDPQLGETLRSSAPLVKACQDRFAAWLGPRPVRWGDGPLVTRTGTQTTVQIEAQPTAPETIDPIAYRCEFEGETLGDARPVG